MLQILSNLIAIKAIRMSKLCNCMGTWLVVSLLSLYSSCHFAMSDGIGKDGGRDRGKDGGKDEGKDRGKDGGKDRGKDRGKNGGKDRGKDGGKDCRKDGREGWMK